ncbi:hypothetical protein J437_LFUL011657 [Ladona fulva]|uniref:PA domain-containing protein n=1 Tax=Ladona fulva TaxID=123851 RepID=A0A8K0P5Z2_LADFU|nr:hypothetical protein J437_LFUL011657 [Ladona fulva]
MVLAVVYLLALASAVESAATGPAAVVDWTRGATGAGSTPVATIVSLEEAEYTTAILNVTYWDPDTNTTKSESKEIGKYGEGRVGPVSGVLVHVGPEDDRGCVLPLTQDPLPTEPWIALIRRGECNFDVKVENAYKSHAAGVIIFDIKNSSNLEKMKLSPQSECMCQCSWVSVESKLWGKTSPGSLNSLNWGHYRYPVSSR